MKYGARTSPIQFCLWLALTFLNIVNIYCEVLDYYHFQNGNLISMITSMVQILLLSGSLSCHFFSEPHSSYQSPGEDNVKETSKESPLMSASYPSYVAFSWFTGIYWSKKLYQPLCLSSIISFSSTYLHPRQKRYTHLPLYDMK